MKKILAALASLTIVSSTSANLVSCESISYWTNFIDAVNNKETFVYLISAQDCPNCKKTMTTINFLYDESELSSNHIANAKNNFQNILLNNTNSATALSTYVNKSSSIFNDILNSKLVDTSKNSYTDSKTETNLWNLKWAKKIENWVVDQVRLAFKINGNINKVITAKTLGFEQTPTFIYILDGKFEGFTQGSIGTYGKPDPTTYIKNLLSNMLGESWRVTLPNTIDSNLSN